MGADLNGVPRAGAERVNQFALVIYIPDPLAQFLDDLRRELVAGCRPRAHVTVLPPRPLADTNAAIHEAEVLVPDFAPFRIEAGGIEVFPRTNVIYIGISRGAAELIAMHKALNAGAMAFQEPFDYHPHITLAQDFDQAQLPRLAALARERWSGWSGPRAFPAERAAFVQNTASNCWIDLAEFALGAVKV